MAARAHGPRNHALRDGYVRARWYSVAGTRTTPTHVMRAQKNNVSDDVPGANDRWTISPRSQMMKASMTRNADRFADPRGFRPRTYAPRNALTTRAAKGSIAPRVRTNSTGPPAVIRTQSRRRPARRGADSSPSHARPRASWRRRDIVAPRCSCQRRPRAGAGG